MAARVLRPWIDKRVPTGGSPGGLLQVGRANVEVTFIGMESEDAARAFYPADQEENTIVAPALPGIYKVGAVCPAILGADARVSTIYPPVDVDVDLDDPDVVVVGDATQWQIDETKEAADKAGNAWSKAHEVDGALTQARTELETQMGVLDRNLGDARETADEAAWDAAAAILEAVAAREAAQAAGGVLRIDSSRGTTFKQNNVSTVLTVTVFKGEHTITDIYGLWDVFGPTAFLEWSWRREDDDEFGLISASDARLSNAGFSLTVSPADVDEKTVFQCAVQA